MGRIKTQLIKRLTVSLIKQYGEGLSPDFSQNKAVVKAHLAGGSKKLRNAIAGYAARIKKRMAAEQA